VYILYIYSRPSLKKIDISKLRLCFHYKVKISTFLISIMIIHVKLTLMIKIKSNF